MKHRKHAHKTTENGRSLFYSTSHSVACIVLKMVGVASNKEVLPTPVCAKLQGTSQPVL